MNEVITCIFCTQPREATDEHVVPEFLGGSLIIREVCKTCNDKMGSDFEGPISRSIVFRFPRALYNIQGKSPVPIAAFPKLGSAQDGSKFEVDSQLKPRAVTKVEERKLGSGAIEVNITVDASEREKIPQIFEAKIRRTAKAEWPDMSAEEVDLLVKNTLNTLPQEYDVQEFSPTIGYKESIDLEHIFLLMMKIAYELAFHHNGANVLSDSANAQLRQAIHQRDIRAIPRGKLFPDPDPFSYVTAPENCHCAVLCRNICYVRLFNLSAIIQVSAEKSEFTLNTEQWVIYLFDFTNLKWEKEVFTEYLSRPMV